MTTTVECPHGALAGTECRPCDRAADVGRGPAATAPRPRRRTTTARWHGHCLACGVTAIFPGDTLTLDNDTDLWVCHACAPLLDST